MGRIGARVCWHIGLRMVGPPCTGMRTTSPPHKWGALARGCVGTLVRMVQCAQPRRHTIKKSEGPDGARPEKWRRGTRRSSAHEYNRYRCSLPGLTELTTHRREGTDSGRHGG